MDDYRSVLYKQLITHEVVQHIECEIVRAAIEVVGTSAPERGVICTVVIEPCQ